MRVKDSFLRSNIFYSYEKRINKISSEMETPRYILERGKLWINRAEWNQGLLESVVARKEHVTVKV